jgi:hypothetical protein
MRLSDLMAHLLEEVAMYRGSFAPGLVRDPLLRQTGAVKPVFMVLVATISIVLTVPKNRSRPG